MSPPSQPQVNGSSYAAVAKEGIDHDDTSKVVHSTTEADGLRKRDRATVQSGALGAALTGAVQKQRRRRLHGPPPGAGFGPMYSVMRFIGERCAAHFFKRVEIIGGEDIPKDGPIIVCATHFSTIMDVALISAYLPHRRPIHYWAKRGLYKRQPFRWILHSSGNIMVDRKTKDNQDLFAGTFEAMKAGEAIGLFPEGGSYTEHRLHGMKAGAAWAALEFAKHLVLEGAVNPAKTKLLIVPASLNYTEKSRFRGDAIFQYGKAFSIDDFTREFLAGAAQDLQESYFAQPRSSGDTASGAATPAFPGHSLKLGLDTATASGPSAPPTPGLGGPTTGEQDAAAAAKRAVAKLTDKIGEEIHKMTIDAPDWKTWHAAKMARELVWWRPAMVPLKDFVEITNAFISLFDSSELVAEEAMDALFTLQAVSLAARTEVFTLNHLARRMAPATARTGWGSNRGQLDARRAASALPSTSSAAIFVLDEAFKLALRLPHIALMAVIYAPAYIVGASLSLKYASHEEESMASAKALCAFVIAFLTHAVLVTIVAALFLFTPPGWVLGLAASWMVERVHLALIDDTYFRFKRLHAGARVLFATLPFSGPQLGLKTREVAIALSAYGDGSPVQHTYRKALRQMDMKRPQPTQLVGLALAAHSEAANALKDLLDAVERDAKEDGEAFWASQRDAAAFIRDRMPLPSARLRIKKA
ncbi:hypothetical protein IE81DRAFT_349442 [Ceraceosorus guamensis]|uniref:Phospholipid/glycerol acyltransferase domain-containing protein n=1 Tax=Ceraceosorus guamensis TaxID=1522189 RepID=A0A316VRS7_9BASI|nr:hypothetical protein IE81DRAFT_349442 [Ceraceosorus guamensis]PWN40212.1 hypothetical protein IE81DRAFT_349442 [Ceraceosorus guamensis]